MRPRRTPDAVTAVAKAIGAPPRFVQILAAPTAIGAALVWGYLLAQPARLDQPWGIWLLGVMLTAITLPCWIARMQQPWVMADAKGVRTRAAPAISWDQIAGHTLRTEVSELGQVENVLVLLDKTDHPLAYLRLANVPEEERERLLEFVRERQGTQPPAAELIAAPAPEGTGVEPEAAPSPAGRGTEPEAAESSPNRRTPGQREA